MAMLRHPRRLRQRGAAATIGTIAVGLLVASCGGGTAPTVPPTTSPSGTSSRTAPATSAPPLEPPSGTGAYGYVTAGPTCPVERPDQPCPPHPVSAVIDAHDSSRHTVASTHSDGYGRYALDLPPGRYVVVVAISSVLPHCPDTAVTVRPGAATRADISCDTGIR